jgi:hypothetical protein
MVGICGFCHWEIHTKAEALPMKMRPVPIEVWEDRINKEIRHKIEDYKLKKVLGKMNFIKADEKRKKMRRERILNTKY